MELRQKAELRKLLVPQLRQSLQILALPQLDLKATIQEELDNNPFLEESQAVAAKETLAAGFSSSAYQNNRQRVSGFSDDTLDFRMSLISQKESLQDVLLRQLGMFADTDEVLLIGQEIIGSLDENGYLKLSLLEIAHSLQVPIEKAEEVLSLVQQFEPAGIAARSVSECLLIQLKASGEKGQCIKEIIKFHLEDIAKKNYSRIAKSLKTPLEVIEPLIKRILRLDPKPGRNYSQDEAVRVIPDAVISKNGDELIIALNNEDSYGLHINNTYRQMLENNSLGQEAKEFLHNKLRNALELVRAVSKRQETLRKIIQVVVEIQQAAIQEDFSFLKPLTFKEVALRITMHETTVCRAVMNKYVELPSGTVVSLKNFFTSRLSGKDGELFSSGQVKVLIHELITQEDACSPLSDASIARLLAQEKQMNISRRTVAKYRDELKILPSSQRKIR